MLVANINKPLLALETGTTTDFPTAENLPIISESFTTFRQTLDKIKVVMLFIQCFPQWCFIVLSLNKVECLNEIANEERMLKSRHQDGPKEKNCFCEATNITKKVKNTIYLPLVHHQLWLDFHCNWDNHIFGWSKGFWLLVPEFKSKKIFIILPTNLDKPVISL